LEFIICGDVNINYLEPSIRKTELDDMLNTYNLMGMVYFPTRNVKNSATLMTIYSSTIEEVLL
jgi:phenolic acid decarboxylase